MAAGLPGFGLSGAFFVVSALLMLPIEIVATLRGRSSLARWSAVLRSAGIALAIVTGIELTYAALHFAVAQLSGPAGAASGSVTAIHGGLAQPAGRTVNVVHTLPVLPILGTLGLVAIVIVSAKAAEVLSRLRLRQSPSGIGPTSPAAEPRSPGTRPRRARPHRDLVGARTIRAHVRPHLGEHDRVANEFEHAA